MVSALVIENYLLKLEVKHNATCGNKIGINNIGIIPDNKGCQLHYLHYNHMHVKVDLH